MPFLASSEAQSRAARLDVSWNEAGIDPFGVSREHVARLMTILDVFSRRYFDLEVHGIEHVPDRGRCMIVGNHSGGFALDGAMVLASLFFRKDPPRLAQGMVEKFLNKLPFANLWANRAGQFTGLPEHAERLLDEERALLVFPEGAKGTEKLFKNRYDLLEFGTGFVRLAIAKKAPIVPFGFLGGGEAVPTIRNAYTLGKLLGVPYVPVTPWGLPIPLPVHLDLLFGEPLFFEGTGNEDDEYIRECVAKVKASIRKILDDGMARRSGR